MATRKTEVIAVSKRFPFFKTERFEKSKYQYQNNEEIGNFDQRELQERCSRAKPQKYFLPKAALINLQKSHRSRTKHIKHSRLMDKAYIG